MPLSWLTEELEKLQRRGLLRSPRTLDGPIGPEVTVDGRRVLLLCSNDYLGLAGHPRVRDAALTAIERFGVGSGSSRLVSGTQRAHRALEDRLAHWLGTEKALLMSTGFQANLSVMTSLLGPQDVVFSDAFNHASIVQGCRLSRARVVIYSHNDVQELEQLLKQHQGRRRVIVTDALFSVDGDLASVEQLSHLADSHEAVFVVDEAHSLGVLGPDGRGLCAIHDVAPDVIVGTFGKAFGCSGAFVAGSGELIRYLVSRAVPYIYTTAPPPAIAAAVDAALDLVIDAEIPRRVLHENVTFLRQAIHDVGGETGASDSHIVPVLVPGAHYSVEVSNALFERGVFVQALRPPTVPPGTERLRWTPTSRHTSAQLAEAVAALGSVLEEERTRK